MIVLIVTNPTCSILSLIMYVCLFMILGTFNLSSFYISTVVFLISKLFIIILYVKQNLPIHLKYIKTQRIYICLEPYYNNNNNKYVRVKQNLPIHLKYIKTQDLYLSRTVL